MGGWMAHNPELADELTVKYLPIPWKQRVEDGELDLEDVPWEILGPVMLEVDRAYMDRLADQADYLRKGRREEGL